MNNFNFLFVSSKDWHDEIFHKLSKRKDEFWVRISDKNDFNAEFLEKHNIKRIFIAHWSYIIPKIIWDNYECILFHMTDLPYGRGGSPLQNLILRGKRSTKISAIRVNEGLDQGDIYLKKDLSLSGSALQIYKRSAEVVFNMILEILSKNPIPTAQFGEVVYFKRRSPKDSVIPQESDLESLFNFIRMLDAPGYPMAFIEYGSFRFEFSKAIINNNEIKADVKIIRK